LKDLVLTRVDPGINRNWGAASPDALVPADRFSVRWAGELEVPFTSAWTFTANCDDCVRLWVNGQLLFDKWGQQSGVEWVGTIDLAEGQKYSVVLEYYENTGDARAILYWNSPYWLTPYQPKQIIPQGAFSLPVRARGPKPAHSAVDAMQTSILRWTAGEKAVSHDVYFGDDAGAVAAADSTTADIYRGRQTIDAVSFDPGPLEWNKTYYWRIDEVNDADPESPWKGAVWAFTTANFLVVEDFEAYNDDMEGGTAIYQTWIDGVENGTASYVGYETANQGTFGETTVVHGDAQSMPLNYNNGKPPYYAQTDRTWSTSQDWTVHGASTLVLYVHGGSLNEAGPLYVALEDTLGNTATVVHEDAAAVTSIAWFEWKIPLSRFSGVNAAEIKRFSIGVGSPDAPAPGGVGTIYVDDIRVTAP
jgi:hypothetical protein